MVGHRDGAGGAATQMGAPAAARRLSDAARRQTACRDAARSALAGLLQRLGETVRGAAARQRLRLAWMRRPAREEQDLEARPDAPVLIGEPLGIDRRGAEAIRL